jgi:hypothetical protein
MPPLQHLGSKVDCKAMPPSTNRGKAVNKKPASKAGSSSKKHIRKKPALQTGSSGKSNWPSASERRENACKKQARARFELMVSTGVQTSPGFDSEATPFYPVAAPSSPGKSDGPLPDLRAPASWL